MLKVAARKRLREFSIDVDVSFPRGTTVVLGASGQGKTTILNMIAGITRPDHGSITLDGRSLFDAGPDLDVPLEERNIGYVFQDFLLFPHLSTYENIAYGLRARGQPRSVIAKRVGRELERFSLTPLSEARPAQLSAGQRQRVALARTLVTSPRVLLMDEPLSALDVQLRGRVRSELRETIRELDIPVIVVSHEPQDATALAERIIVVERGRVVQSGGYEDLLSRPSSRFVAEFVGANAFAGVVEGYDGTGLAQVRLSGGAMVCASYLQHAARVLVVIYPRDVLLLHSQEAGSARNVFRGIILGIYLLADHARLTVDIGTPIVAEVSRASLVGLSFKQGEEVYVAVKAVAIRVFSLDGNEPSHGSSPPVAGDFQNAEFENSTTRGFKP
jgi:molybdate transport system ATP-binding protein